MKPLRPLLAGTSGFRGKTGIDVTVEHARVIGAQYGKWLRTQTGKDRPTITVGHDQRYGTRELADSVMAGLIHVGVNAVGLGMVPTGVFTFGMTSMSHDGGILITGSHMDDPRRIGIIPVNGDGSYATNEVTDFIAEGFDHYDKIMNVPPEGGGLISFADTEALMSSYCAHIVRSVNADAIRSARFRLVVDAGNGTMGEVAANVLMMLNVEVHGLFMRPDEVPGRGSECKPENCERAIHETMSRDSDGPFDLGVAFDGDGDRGMFISPINGALDGDVVAGIFAKWMLDEGDVCVTPVSTGALINHVAREQGASVELCRVGQPATGAATKQHGAKFYCESASQKFGFPHFSLGYDALFALIKMLQYMAAFHKSIDQLVRELPVFHRFEVKLPLEGFHAQNHGAFALARAKGHFGKGTTKTCEIDGLRFDFEDGSWLLLRPSGTEPYFRIYVSGPDRVKAHSLMQHARRNVAISLGLEKP